MFKPSSFCYGFFYQIQLHFFLCHFDPSLQFINSFDDIRFPIILCFPLVSCRDKRLVKIPSVIMAPWVMTLFETWNVATIGDNPLRCINKMSPSTSMLLPPVSQHLHSDWKPSSQELIVSHNASSVAKAAWVNETQCQRRSPSPQPSILTSPNSPDESMGLLFLPWFNSQEQWNFRKVFLQDHMTNEKKLLN